jgi:hypothetical protein
MAVGEVWDAADARGESAAAVTRDCGAKARRGPAISASLVAAALILGLWGGRWQAENSAQVGAHAGPPGGWLTESPRSAHPMFGAGAATSSGAGDPTMRPTSSLTAAALATTINAAMAAGALAGDAVQWRVADGGNGHWYQAIKSTTPLTWSAARDRATGVGGHLATFESEGEFPAVVGPIAADVGLWIQATWWRGPWIGAYQDHTATDFAEPAGGWRWVTGAPVAPSFFSSFGYGNPNNYPCCEDYLQIGENPLAAAVNDVPQSATAIALIVEWSADCNNDGIIDYGQIRDGTFSDTNANGVPDCCESGQTCCIGDIYHDGIINGADLGIVLSEWGPVTPTTHSDLDHNGRVDGADLGLLLSHWGPCGG